MMREVTRYDLEPTPEELAKCLANDKIKRHPSLYRILNLINHAQGAYTLLIDGAWGSGKTYAVKQIIEVLRHKNSFLEAEVDKEILDAYCNATGINNFEKSFIPVYFNAWDNDHYDDPLCPLLCEIAIQLDQNVSTKERNYLKPILAVLDSVLPVNAEKVIGGLNGGKGFLEEYQKRIELRDKFDKVIGDAINTDTERLILFIDELDRCRPEFAIKLLEQTKRLFNNPKVLIIISTDTVQLGHALSGVYGNDFDGAKYLERFYDRKVELNKVRPLDYLSTLGYTNHGYRGFESVIKSLLESRELTMRDLQKIAPVLISAQDFAPNWFTSNSGAVTLASNGLLPAFIIIAYSEPEIWRKVKDANQYDYVYDYLKDIEGFNALLVYTMSGFSDQTKEISDAERKQYILDTCVVLFADHENDDRVYEAQSRLGYCGGLTRIRKQVVDFNFD